MSCESVWIFGIFVTQIKLSNRTRLQLMYLKLYSHYLLIHLTSKRLKNIDHLIHHRVSFSEVIIFDLSQAKIVLKLLQSIRTHYWLTKTPIILSHLHFLVRFRINKRKKSSSYHLQNLIFQWCTEKDEIHLYTLTMRSKEEWFYRLQKSISINERESNTESSFINQIESEFYYEKHSLLEHNKSLSYPTWHTRMKTFFQNIVQIPSKHSEKQNDDYICLINYIILRCTINFYENIHVRNYFSTKLQHELKHLKLPYYIHWIRLSHFSFDNTYPKIENMNRIWLNQNGLWTSMNLTYQGNISIEFTIELNLIQKQINQKKMYSFIPIWFQSLFHFHKNIQVLRKIVNTIITITINIRSINGILLINIPLPPSDRLWVGFENMPSIDFDVQHRQISSNKSQSSINTKNDLNKQLNQLQTAINHLLSQWIKKQIYTEYVLPNIISYKSSSMDK
ncbi:hypothetical protein I4U23_018679 [Adineta vaga]|nr:hypothetical protein I4U23_018679 [Adineta vaga]